ncbi:hypothetical protein OF83DRAFT_592964 [Amylostereum chailletii]|nr:hypothetical protein OF83DRAFT_592964 [Amylostereum chailletii]
MKAMLLVLIRLRDVPNKPIISDKSSTMKDPMHEMVENTVKDIKRCFATCSAMQAKSMLAKVVHGPVWNQKLFDFMNLFDRRRMEFILEISIHTNQSVESAKSTMNEMATQTNLKMDQILRNLEALSPPAQQTVARAVNEKGGPQAVLRSNTALKDLDVLATRLTAGDSGSRASRNKGSFGRHELSELTEEPDRSIANILPVFSQRFEQQQRELKIEFDRLYKQGATIIKMIQKSNTKSHSEIIEQLWSNMEWRGNVKAKHFVLALRDYYVEKIGPFARSSQILDTDSTDSWAIKHIDILYLQPIMEAFDDDASGFITIAEMNHFTSSRPKEWSLPHWIAYWAVGWKAGMIHYSKMIEDVFAKMEGLLPHILPANREAVDDYHIYVWDAIHTFTAPLVNQTTLVSLDKFRAYLDIEQKRLQENLQSSKFVIDNVDMVSIITGPGRIEKTLMPLLYLMVDRHYQIMRMSTKKVVAPGELFSSVESILYVKDAVRMRFHTLKNIFSQQQKSDPEKQFQSFCFGLFKYFEHTENLLSANYVKGLDPIVIAYDDATEDQNIKPEIILREPVTDPTETTEPSLCTHW